MKKLLTQNVALRPLPIVAWRAPNRERVHRASDGGHTLRTVVIRPGIVYGDGGGIPGMMAAQAKAGELRIVGDDANRWPLVRIDEIADLYLRALERSPAQALYKRLHSRTNSFRSVRAVFRLTPRLFMKKLTAVLPVSARPRNKPTTSSRCALFPIPLTGVSPSTYVSAGKI